MRTFFLHRRAVYNQQLAPRASIFCAAAACKREKAPNDAPLASRGTRRRPARASFGVIAARAPSYQARLVFSSPAAVSSVAATFFLLPGRRASDVGVRGRIVVTTSARLLAYVRVLATRRRRWTTSERAFGVQRAAAAAMKAPANDARRSHCSAFPAASAAACRSRLHAHVHTDRRLRDAAATAAAAMVPVSSLPISRLTYFCARALNMNSSWRRESNALAAV